MSDAPKSKPSFKQGDVVHAPFASPNADGTYSKHRTAYVAEVANGEAKLVYISASGKPLDGLRYTGELDKHLEGMKKNSFWDAGQTTTVPTDYLTLQSAKLRPETQAALEHSIAKERSEYMDAQKMVRELREKAAASPSSAFAAEKNAAADKIVARTEAAHRHVRIDHDGNVRHKTVEQGWQHHGKVLHATMAEMQKDAVRYAPAADHSKKEGLDATTQVKPAPSPNDGKIVVVKENGSEALLGPKSKEQLRTAFHGELGKAGHTGALPDAGEIKRIAILVAGAREGERVAITASGAHHLLAKDMPHPPGATVLDAVALRASAKIAESALARALTGPQLGGVQGVMAAAAFFDNASGRALSASPLGQAVAYAGEKSGAFYATMKTQEAVEPLIDKAGKALSAAAERSGVTAFVGEQLAKQVVIAEKLQKATGFDTVMKKVEELATTGRDKLESAIRNNVHGPDNPVHRADNVLPFKAAVAHDAVSSVQAQMNKGMHDAGNPAFKLTAAEGVILAKELATVKPGDHLVVEKSGDIYLALSHPGQKQPDAPKSAVVFDADALRENAGIARATEMGKQAQPTQDASAKPPEIVRSM